MAGELTIYSIYKLKDEDKYYLLSTVRPAYSNASQHEEDKAISTEQDNRARLLGQISRAGFELVGELQDYPVGDDLYTADGGTEIEIYYMGTRFGHPWIVLGTAGSEGEFLSELNNDEDLLRLEPIGQPIKIEATYLTDDNFSLLQRPENTKFTDDQINK